MPDVLILADPPAMVTPSLDVASPVMAMKQAILACSTAGDTSSAFHQTSPPRIEIMFTAGGEEQNQEQFNYQDWILCPLTLNLPKSWMALGYEVFSSTADLPAMRQRVSDWQYSIGEGNHWLPIVLTAKGPLFAEAITQCATQTHGYQQPLHLQDALRQPLYELGQRLLRSLAAPPSVYLLQFGMEQDRVWFDRLIPYPAEPAIASVGVQTPDLYQCHWLNLIGQPIRELTILA